MALLFILFLHTKTYNLLQVVNVNKVVPLTENNVVLVTVSNAVLPTVQGVPTDIVNVDAHKSRGHVDGII